MHACVHEHMLLCSSPDNSAPLKLDLRKIAVGCLRLESNISFGLSALASSSPSIEAADV